MTAIQKHGECPKCGASLGWDGPKYVGEMLVNGYFNLIQVGHLEFACRNCGFTAREQTADDRREADRESPPELPPNRTVVDPAPWQRCFWFPHKFTWRSVGRTWIQQQCERCGATGRLERRSLAPPAPPPPPPPPSCDTDPGRRLRW